MAKIEKYPPSEGDAAKQKELDVIKGIFSEDTIPEAFQIAQMKDSSNNGGEMITVAFKASQFDVELISNELTPTETPVYLLVAGRKGKNQQDTIEFYICKIVKEGDRDVYENNKIGVAYEEDTIVRLDILDRVFRVTQPNGAQLSLLYNNSVMHVIAQHFQESIQQ